MITLFVFLFGVSFGSFLNVLIYRVPQGMSIINPPSTCPCCNNRLKWYHNIPLLSWIVLRGKCGFCKSKISFIYPLIELTSGFLWVALYLKVGLVWYLPFVAISFSLLLALSMIDFKYYAVPDSLNLAALLFALVNIHPLTTLFNAAFAAAGFWILGTVVSRLAKKEALGGADIIVAATMAALLGYPAFFIAMFLAALLAMIPSLFAKDTKVPFVPFLALATLITYLNSGLLVSYLEALMYG